jgi:serine/threonine protein kinase/uncharacterized protein HemY
MSPHEHDRVSNIAAPPEAPDTPCSEQEDPRVTHAALEYLDALRAGRRPDRAELLARHPDIAAELAECLDGLELIHAAAAHLHGSVAGPVTASHPLAPPTAPTDFPPSTHLGDYRIVREIGRGGMGVVYEAVQISLGRQVAVKVLPSAFALDPRQQQRFKNEAEAAALLHHSNIVPVHAVGCERGAHFYVMQYVEGQSVAALIRELRQHAGLEAAPTRQPPATDGNAGGQPVSDTAPNLAARLSTERSAKRRGLFHAVARLGAQAAEALEHAHQLGVVHRDIKPDNLLVDAQAHLWVTDFGLAYVLGEAQLTLTGDVVGTLRYMSPEQALARRAQLDHRTDIYSLGATLYELLALEPAFPGRDRQELLRQIATEPPRPLRRLGPAIPADLETIVLKAMSKEPEGRYATAQELADDLRRFLEDKPIKAQRPGLGQRAARWARRHRAVVACAAIVLVIASVVLALSTVLIQVARLKAVQQRDAARRAVDDMYTDVAERWLEQEPEMEEVQRELLLKALRYYQEFAQERGTDPAVRFATALAYRRVGDIQQKLGDFSSAEPAYTQSIRLLARLAEDFPAQSKYRTALAHAHHNLAGLLALLKRDEEAERAYRRAVALREQLVEGAPSSSQCRHDLAASVTALGRVQQGRGRPLDAQQQYCRALSLLKELVPRSPKGIVASHASQPDQGAAALSLLAVTQGHLAGLHWSSGRLAQARQLLEQAIGHQRLALKFRPRHPVYRKHLAVQLASLGRTLVRLGELAQAEEAYRQALAVQEKLAEDFPRTPRYRSDLASLHQEVGDVLTARGRQEEARQAYAQVVAILERLVQDFPASPGHCRDLAWALATCPALDLRDAGEAVRLARQAVKLAPRGGGCWRALGVACYRAKDWQGAVTALRKATELHSGGDGWEWFFLAMAHWQLGERQQARAWYERGRRWAEDRPKASSARRAQAEAAALLGLTGQQAEPAQQDTGRGEPE